jgi:proprotein convertase subtilisin/kexin type 5
VGAAVAGEDKCPNMPFCTDCVNPAPVCTWCEYGTLMSADGKACMDLPDNCEKYAEKGSSRKAECTKCEENYYQADEGGVKECRKCNSNCGECSEDVSLGSTCDTCQDGFYNTEENDKKRPCSDCGDNCVECQDSSKCKVCKAQYYLAKPSGKCMECPSMSDCIHCKGGDKCDMCMPAMYWDASATKCKDCMDNCADCEDKDTCKECNFNFKTNAGNVECISTINCEEAADGSGCTSCKRGYKLDANGDRCVKCATLDSTSCEMCSYDNRGQYYKAADDTCNVCVEFCLACDDGESCNMCLPGYVWWEDTKKCVACSKVPSADLDDTGKMPETSCDICDEYYWLPELRDPLDNTQITQDKECKECPANADDYVTMEQCEDCDETKQSRAWAPGMCNKGEEM